jgi:hypothetical protein
VDRPTLEVADIFRRYGDAYRQQASGSLSTAQRRVMTAIETCRDRISQWNDGSIAARGLR